MTRVIQPGHPEWTPLLAQVAATPGVPQIKQLFALGIPLEPHDRYVAIVGTRRADATGLDMATEIAGRLAEAGFVVVSGMAVGIDGAAHKGALAAGGKTVAVLGCGLDLCYPGRHRALKGRIEHQGAVLSEYADGTAPESWHFPERNRIIAALSRVVIVIQGGQKSGALITAGFANKYERDVLAVPGNPLCKRSSGCHRLVRSNSAALVSSIEDVFEEIAPDIMWADAGPLHDRSTAPVPPGLDTGDLQALTLLDDLPRPPVALARRSDLTTGHVAMSCARLEVRGLAAKRRAGFVVTPAGIRVRNSLDP